MSTPTYPFNDNLRDILSQTATQLLSRILRPDAVLDLLLKQLLRAIPDVAANIMLIEGEAAVMTRSLGYANDGPATELKIQSVRTYQHMLETHEAVIINDTATNADWVLIPAYEWVQAYLGIPLYIEQQTIGIINLDSNRPNFFAEDHLQFMNAFAGLASVAIYNARLYESQKQTTDELKSLYEATSVLFTANTPIELCQQIAKTVVQAFSFVDCGVMLVDSETRQIKRAARAGELAVTTSAPLFIDGHGLVPTAIRENQVTYAPDVHQDARYAANEPNIASELVIPLHFRHEVIGALDLQSDRPNAFSKNDLRVLQAFAERAAAALDNVRLYDAIRSYASNIESQFLERTKQLAETNKQVEAILNNASDAITFIDTRGRIIRANPAFSNFFKYDEKHPHYLGDFLSPENQQTFEIALQHVTLHHISERIEVMATTQHRKQLIMDMALSPVDEQSLATSGVICSLRDITHRKRIEDDLRRALQREKELNELKTRFITTASHEFRTPLTVIKSAKDVLLRYYERMDDAKRLQYLQQIDTAVQVVTHLLDDVLTISQADAGRLQFKADWHDLEPICKSVIEDLQFATQSQSDIVFTVTGEKRHIYCDSQKIQQIMNNLLSNALKYTHNGEPIACHLIYHDDGVRIDIQDEGIGIPQEDQAHIFERFHRATNVSNIQGTGLGLAIVKRAVEMHEGTITVESQLNQGTTFHIYLPYIQEAQDK